MARRASSVARPLIVVALIVSFSATGHPAVAEAPEQDNFVSSPDYAAGSFGPEAGTVISHVPGPTVDNINAAYAQGQCTGCRSVAVALQVVIVEGPVDDFRPFNGAVALNLFCAGCEAFAYARQDVLLVGTPVVLDAHTLDLIDLIRAEVAAVAASGASFDQIVADLDALGDELVGLVEGAIADGGGSAVWTSDRRTDAA